jgi:hypothetical protein
MEPDFVVDSQTPIEVQQINATAQQDVLAVVDHLPIVTTGGPGCGTAAEEITRFVNIDFESRAAESDGRGEAREAASDQSDARH